MSFLRRFVRGLESIGGRFCIELGVFFGKNASEKTFFYTKTKVFNMFKSLMDSDIDREINIFPENFQKNARRIEKSCTFAPAELKEGLPLKMI